MAGKPLKNPNAPYWMSMYAHERGLIERALEAAGGSICHAATILGVSRQFLGQRARKCGVKTKYGYSDERRQQLIESRERNRREKARIEAHRKKQAVLDAAEAEEPS